MKNIFGKYFSRQKNEYKTGYKFTVETLGERIQRITLSELTKIAIVHLYAQGYQDAELVNFELDLTNPSTIYEEEKVELWNNKTSLASSLLNDGIVSTEWIYKNIFNFT